MRKPKVFISHWMPQNGVDRVKEHCDVDYLGNTVPLSREQMIAGAKDADAALVFVPDTIDQEFLDQCPNLRLISSFGRGFDNIDIDACTKRGILVTVNPSALTDSTADIAIGLLLALSRNIVKGDAHVRHGAFSGWHARNLLGHDFHHSTLGIVGMGNIGQAIAKRAMGFDVSLLYHDVQPIPEKESQYHMKYVSMKELVSQSDFIVLATNLTDESYHLIGKEQLHSFKPGSYLINIARGSIVDEQAVNEALETGTIAGYAADVFEFEDPSNPHRPERIPVELLAKADQTVFTPHIGTGTIEARERLAFSSTDQMLTALRGEVPTGAVNDVRIEPMIK